MDKARRYAMAPPASPMVRFGRLACFSLKRIGAGIDLVLANVAHEKGSALIGPLPPVRSRQRAFVPARSLKRLGRFHLSDPDIGLWLPIGYGSPIGLSGHGGLGQSIS